MKNTLKTLSICLTGLILSFGFYSCNDDSENFTPIQDPPEGSNDLMEVLLTDNLVKEWRLVNIYDQTNSSINTQEWSECKKSEILTFHSDNTFSVSCSEKGVSLFTWNVLEIGDQNLLNLESVNTSATSSEWLTPEIIIHILTDNILVIEINGERYEYAPYYLENSDPRDYQ